MNEGRRNSIESLKNLYTVVIGVGLSLSAVQLVNRPEGITSIPPHEFLLFLAFISTLVPFYHGALRHLDDAYLENDNLHIRDGALIIDVLLLLAHGMVFLILALLLHNPNQFAWVLIALIVVDVLWGISAHLGFSSRSDHGAEGKWTMINVIFVISVGGALLFFDIGLKPDADATKVAAFVLAACFLRTLVDYRTCWSFYFPSDGPRES